MGENVPKVQKGDPITAEAWNTVVEKVNGKPDVSLRRGKRRQASKPGTSFYISVTTDGGLLFTFNEGSQGE